VPPAAHFDVEPLQDRVQTLLETADFAANAIIAGSSVVLRSHPWVAEFEIGRLINAGTYAKALGGSGRFARRSRQERSYSTFGWKPQGCLTRVRREIDRTLLPLCCAGTRFASASGDTDSSIDGRRRTGTRCALVHDIVLLRPAPAILRSCDPAILRSWLVATSRTVENALQVLSRFSYSRARAETR
jgi:hypothetical protein